MFFFLFLIATLTCSYLADYLFVLFRRQIDGRTPNVISHPEATGGFGSVRQEVVELSTESYTSELRVTKHTRTIE